MTVVVAVLAGALVGVGMLVLIPRVPAKTSLPLLANIRLEPT